MNITDKLLTKVGPKGKYAVVRTLVVHTQPNCVDIPAATMGVIKSTHAVIPGAAVVVFPHTATNTPRAFSDGCVRVISLDNLQIIGRVG